MTETPRWPPWLPTLSRVLQVTLRSASSSWMLFSCSSLCLLAVFSSRSSAVKSVSFFSSSVPPPNQPTNQINVLVRCQMNPPIKQLVSWFFSSTIKSTHQSHDSSHPLSNQPTNQMIFLIHYQINPPIRWFFSSTINSTNQSDDSSHSLSNQATAKWFFLPITR